MRFLMAIGAVATLLAGCDGHQYEPKKSGITTSGEVGVGVKYQEGQGTSLATNNEVKISVSGSI
ncbi:hypothetical protein K3X44_03370 [Aliiroseovarius crassostreae]|uniref:hypothetical protein n=1 Tax=Aliiroseovarius crassostreae TaxID=154981 RepID=UPI00220A4DD1|nr:hypothetical protein [Aliiroseovarius crassostreae]UWQ02395.1 hypothetical protein K3X44_03370 [Aliiroseovarius crassostreae]